MQIQQTNKLFHFPHLGFSSALLPTNPHESGLTSNHAKWRYDDDDDDDMQTMNPTPAVEQLEHMMVYNEVFCTRCLNPGTWVLNDKLAHCGLHGTTKFTLLIGTWVSEISLTDTLALLLLSGTSALALNNMKHSVRVMESTKLMKESFFC